MTSTHRLPFEVAVPVHAKFNRQDAPHHWTISSRTLRQLMDHFGPGIEYLDINTDGDHVNFTCFSEKTVNEDGMKDLVTSGRTYIALTSTGSGAKKAVADLHCC